MVLGEAGIGINALDELASEIEKVATAADELALVADEVVGRDDEGAPPRAGRFFVMVGSLGLLLKTSYRALWLPFSVR